MRVVAIDSRMPVKFLGLLAHTKLSDEVRFFAGAACTFWAPALLYCFVIGHLLPFYLMVCSEILGVTLGALMYQKGSGRYLSCVPVTEVPDVPSNSHSNNTKRAA